jgi:hypothetical protein
MGSESSLENGLGCGRALAYSNLREGLPMLVIRGETLGRLVGGL